MFDDMKRALSAEALDLTPLGSGQHAAASLVAARHARDKDDLAELLGALGLPRADDDLTPLLPHLTTCDTPTGDPMPANAFTATAVSMLNNGDSPDYVRDTLGLSKSELAEAVKHAGLPAPTDADADDKASTPEGSVPPPAAAVDTDGIEALLSWAEQHAAASIRNRASRVRSDLADLAARRATDDAQKEAEARVAKAKAELEAAQAQLRQAKASGRPATTDQATRLPAPAAGPTPAGRRSKEELTAIRKWARANGHQVADRGTPAKTVLDAYDAAHRTTTWAEAS